jgi:hypothetical protein
LEGFLERVVSLTVLGQGEKSPWRRHLAHCLQDGIRRQW